MDLWWLDVRLEASLNHQRDAHFDALFFLEARVVGRDTLGRVHCGLHRISALLVPFAIQKLRSFAFVSGVVRTEYEPACQRSVIVERLLIMAPRRDHQIPAHQRERGSIPRLHASTS
jgi:hypothetical protein